MELFVGLRPFVSDIAPLLFSLVGLGGLIALAERLRTYGVSVDNTRRLVHVGVSLFLVATPYVFSTPFPVYGLAGLFVVVNATALSKSWWAGIHRARSQSVGTVALPLAAIVALAATWSITVARVSIFQAAFLVLAISDPLASVVGQRWGRSNWIGNASWAGSGAFLGSALVLLTVVFFSSTSWPISRILATSLVITLVSALVEAICRGGWDNLFVPVAIVLILSPLYAGMLDLSLLALALLFGAVFAVVAWSVRTLNGAGAIVGGLFAASLVGLGGWEWAIPGFVFFVFSSLLSRLPANSTIEGVNSPADENGRAVRQVLANGGVAWGCLGIWGILPSGYTVFDTACYIGFLGALSAAAADTWATEVGSRFGKRPRSIRTFRRVPSGTSGGVSLWGTVAGVVGAATVAAATTLAGGEAGPSLWIGMLWVVLAGFIGMTVDSLAGATLERGERASPVHDVIPHPSAKDPYTRGLVWVDNEVVNLIGTSAGATSAVLIWAILG